MHGDGRNAGRGHAQGTGCSNGKSAAVVACRPAFSDWRNRLPLFVRLGSLFESLPCIYRHGQGVSRASEDGTGSFRGRLHRSGTPGTGAFVRRNRPVAEGSQRKVCPEDVGRTDSTRRFWCRKFQEDNRPGNERPAAVGVEHRPAEALLAEDVLEEIPAVSIQPDKGPPQGTEGTDRRK